MLISKTKKSKNNPKKHFNGDVRAVAPIFKGMHNPINKLGTAKLEVFQNYNGHAQWICLIAIKCPEYCLTQSLLGAIIFMHFDQFNMLMHVLIFGGDACESPSRKTVVFFFTSCRCTCVLMPM